MTKTKHAGLLTASLTAVSLVAPSMLLANVPESPDPIRIAVNEWTGQSLSVTIASEVSYRMGSNVRMVIAGALPQLAAIAEGEIAVNPEMCDISVTGAYTNGVASGDIVVPGPLELEPREGWVYPPYMQELCPGLPGYQALYDGAQAFVTAKTFPNGSLVGYPADWGKRVQDAVASLGMPFNVVPRDSEGAMLADLKGAVAAREPILMMFWQQHGIFAEEDLHWVEWNPMGGECIEETQVRHRVCGFAQANVLKVQGRQFATKWPTASVMMAMFTLSNADQKGRTAEEAALEWVAKNEAVRLIRVQ